MHPQTNPVTARYMMSNASLARQAVREGMPDLAKFHLRALYHVAVYSSCPSIASKAMGEILRIESDIRSLNGDGRFYGRTETAEIIPFPMAPDFVTPPPTAAYALARTILMGAR